MNRTPPRVLILALATADRAGSLALTEDPGDALEPRLLVERRFTPVRGHGGSLLSELDRALDVASLAVSDVDVFVACSGPGSFTGLRVGLATTNGLAWALGRPATAFGSLEALALSETSPPGLVSPVIDARKREVYAALFRRSRSTIEPLLAPVAVDPHHWRERVAACCPGEPVAFVGSGVAAYPEVFEGGMPAAPLASVLAAMAASALRRDGVRGLPPAVPRYVRPSEAEVKFGPAPKYVPPGS